MQAAIAGFALGFSLIVAIGAQNAFVLRQGIKREHVFMTCLTCALSDAVLIAAGVAGFGSLAEVVPWLEPLMRYGGAMFLFWYGASNFRSAWQGASVLRTEGAVKGSLKGVLATVLLLTWLNPHVYLDTVVLLGSISAGWDDKLSFSMGAMSASFVFFFSFGYGARYLAPLFEQPRAWQALDAMIGLIMWAIAAKLLF